VSIRVRVLEGGELARVDTPNAQVTITRPGLYRIDVSPDREHTHVVVREGEVNLQTASALQQVLPGQSADIDGPNPQYATVQNGAGIDGFATRGSRTATATIRVSSPGATTCPPPNGRRGDLAQYGSLDAERPIRPRVVSERRAQDWAPYRNGIGSTWRWGPRGSYYAPWGYAPSTMAAGPTPRPLGMVPAQ
jgi:hypothetical protein